MKFPIKSIQPGQIVKLSDSASTLQDCQLMKWQVYEGLKNPIFREFAARFKRAKDPEKAIFDFVFKNIYFYPDPDNFQVVRSPIATLRDQFANCVDYSVLIAACLITCGIKCRFRCIAEKPNFYTHVYVVTNKGTVLDAILGQEQTGLEKLQRLPGASGLFNTEAPHKYKLDYPVYK